MPRAVCLKLAHTGNRQTLESSSLAADAQTQSQRRLPERSGAGEGAEHSAATTVAVAACSVGHAVSAAVTAVRSAGGCSGHRGRFVDGVNVSLFKI